MLGDGPAVELTDELRGLFAHLSEVFALECVVVALKDPFGLTGLNFEEKCACDVGKLIAEWWSLLVVLVRNELLIFLALGNLLDLAVIQRLIGLLVSKTEPSTIELALFADGSTVLGRELPYSQKNHGSRLLHLVESDLNFFVIIDLENSITDVILVSHGVSLTLPAVWVHSCDLFTIRVEDNGLRVVLAF